MATLTAAAARRALSYRSRALLRPHHSTIVDRSKNGANQTRSACTALWGQQPVTISSHQDFRICRSFSSVSTESVSPPAEVVANSSFDSTTPPNNNQISQPRSKHKSNKVIDGDIPSSFALRPLTEDEYDPSNIASRIHDASLWDQKRKDNLPNRKKDERRWDYDYVRCAVDDYERHLQYIHDHIQSVTVGEKVSAAAEEEEESSHGELHNLVSNIHPSPEKCEGTLKLLSAKTLANAVRALLRAKIDTPVLSQRIRDIERLVGLIGWTPITENLSFRLLEANGKAGNVRRTLALLELRRRRGYVPREQMRDLEYTQVGVEPGEKEFIHAITSIKSAQLPLRRSRNIYLHESALEESTLDNPTRYLDAILLNMSQRGVPLRPEIASQMLSCYASTGRTGRALHYFYKVVKDPVEEDGFYIPGPHPIHLGKEELEKWKEERRRGGMGRMLASDSFEEDIKDDGSDDDDTSNKRTKVRMIMNPPPPFHKIPSRVKDDALAQGRDHKSSTFAGVSSNSSSMASSSDAKTKYEWEVDREWSLSLTAAFAFADSLTHGACGHDPIELNVGGWNCLIKACCYRGAFHRALKILNETMPQRGIEPDNVSYNTILSGLAWVGDIALMQEYLTIMTNKGVPIDKYTVKGMADGLLNVGNISGASTIVQDIFNQHDTLPPYTTHLKIIEFALSNGLIFEAKRHVYFIQQLWKWQPSKHHEEHFIHEMEATKHHPKLSRRALQRLFWHFHEELRDDDFF